MKSKKTARNRGFLFCEDEKKLGELLNNEFAQQTVVEVRRIELLSEDSSLQLSPSAAAVLSFPSLYAP